MSVIKSCLPWFLGLLFSLSRFDLVQALEVTPNSDCSSLCVDQTHNDPSQDLSSSTQEADLICNDYELDGPNSTVKGRKWKDCLNCERSSTATDQSTKENDVYWLLFNMKFTIDWCVFGYPDNNITEANTQCSDICGGSNNEVKRALTDRLLQTNSTIQYQYCKDENGAFSKNARACMDCLEIVPSAKTLVNYVNAMNQGCRQQPSAGDTIQLGFDLFPPASKATLSSSAATVTVTSSALPKSSSSTSAPSASGQSGTVSTATVTALASKSNNNGVKVGVGVGIGVACIIAIIAGAIFLLMRHRSAQKKAELEEDTRAQWEAEYRARAAAEKDPRRAELGAAAANYVAEADDGRPQNIPMLESPEDTKTSSSPGGLQHSDHEPFSDSSESNPQSPGTLNSQGLPKYLGRPPVPEKDSRSDSPRPQH